MRYAVLGTGSVGRKLAGKLASLGHEVAVGTRSPEATLARTELDRMGNPPFAEWLGEQPRVRLETFADAVAAAEIIVNATAGQGSVEALEQAGAANLAGKILVDVANPLDFSRGMPPFLDPVNTDSLGERIQRAFPEAKVVKTLNTMNSAVMVEPSRVPGEHEVFVCGDDTEAKKAVAELLTSFGWPASSIMDLGGIGSARGTEMWLLLFLGVAGALGHADFNLHIARA